ncbi:MAG: site-specific DNA-methyltransferase [Candidatus Riflebacteria bacterium]|nr:site-specific DNA-methyltransferase [Candidatus Riflebacteria bacterium]
MKRSSSFELFHGDAMEVAVGGGWPCGAFRLIYTDPPFFSGSRRIGTLPGLTFDDRWPAGIDAYLDWLELRLIGLKPLLMPSGSLVVHLDYRAVHDIKVRLDRLFGRAGFVNEIIWHYTGGGRARKRFSCKHDTLLWYSNGPNPLFNVDMVRIPYKPTSGYAKGGIISAAGRKYLPNPLGTPVDDVWDIPIINPLSHERTGYPTQKPLALLQRLISALTDEGDLVGDPFCGSGTTLLAALTLGRRALGADVSAAAIALVKKRLETFLEGIYVELIDLPRKSE